MVRAARGANTVYWDEAKQTYVGQVSLGFDASGKRIRPKVYGRTKTEVREKLRELRRERETGVKSSARYTVADAVNDWLSRGLIGRDPSTVDKCRNLADKHVIPHLGRARLRDLTADQVDDWLSLRANVLATRSLKECHSVLRRAIAHAQRRDKVMRNVAELVTVPPGKAGRPSKALTLDQAVAVLTAAEDSRLHAYVVLSLLVGVRTEEARALRWEHVHLTPADGRPPHVEVWRSVRRHGDTKTRKSRRTLALPAEVVTALRNHRKRQHSDQATAESRDAKWPASDLVFRTRAGTALDAARTTAQLRFAHVRRWGSRGDDCPAGRPQKHDHDGDRLP